jgi:hypothetical protein
MVGTTLVGVAALVIALWAMWRKKLPRLRVWLMLIAGMCSLGVFSMFGAALAGLLVTAVGRATTAAIGAGAGLAIGLFVCLELYHAMHPKKGKPQTFHAPLAFLAPTILAACGGLFTTLSVGSEGAVTQMAGFFSGLFG